MPITLVNSGYDDGLFVRQATHLSTGQWLGPFDNLTLAKGSAYPAFIAAMHSVHVPLKVGEQLTFLLAAACLAACVWVVTRRLAAATAVYVVLALDPASFGVVASRVLRDSWYASLTLLLLATLFLAVYGAVTRARLVWVLPVAVLAGLTGAAFWLCREEGPAIAPAFAFITLGVPIWALVRGRSAGTAGPGRRARATSKGVRVVGVLALVGLFASVPVGYVLAQNDQHYGVALTNDVAAGTYARAYADWADVNAGTPSPRVPISFAQRTAVYAISPAAAELAPILESSSNHWRKVSCRQQRVCDDFAGGWEVWALREAALQTGHFSSGTAAQTFFGQVGSDIEAACASGKLSCARHLPPSLEPFQHATLRGVGSAAWHGLVYIGFTTDLTTVPGPVLPVSSAQRKSFASMIVSLPTTQHSSHLREQQFERAWIYPLLTNVYRWLFPLLFLAAVAGIILGWMSKTAGIAPMSLLAAALGIGAMGRLLLLAVIDFTTFSSVASPYQLATRLLLFGFALVGTAVLVDTLINHRASRSRAAGPGDANAEAHLGASHSDVDERHADDLEAHRGLPH